LRSACGKASNNSQLGHRNATHADALLLQTFGHRHDQADFGATGEQDQFGFAVRRIAQYIGATAQAIRYRVAAAVAPAHITPPPPEWCLT
jgi:hypothetical protein